MALPFSAYTPFSGFRPFTGFRQQQPAQQQQLAAQSAVPDAGNGGVVSPLLGALGRQAVSSAGSKAFSSVTPRFGLGSGLGQAARTAGSALGMGTEPDAATQQAIFGGAIAGDPIAGFVGEVLRNVGHGTMQALTQDWDMTKTPQALEQKARMSLAGPLWEKEFEELSPEDLELVTDVPNLFEFETSDALREDLLKRAEIIGQMESDVAFQIEKMLNPSLTREEFGEPEKQLLEYVESINLPDIEQIKSTFTPSGIPGIPGSVRGLNLGLEPLLEEFAGQPIESLLRSAAEEPGAAPKYDFGDISNEFEGVFFLERPEEWAENVWPSRGQRATTTATGGRAMLPQGFGTPQGGNVSFMGLSGMPVATPEDIPFALYLRSLGG